MWTNASVSVLTLIAVHAQKLEALREVVFYEPRVNFLVPIVFFSLDVTIVINMVYSQEKRFSLSATSASITKARTNNLLFSLETQFELG